MALINRGFGSRRPLDPELAERLPPGQHIVEDFPELTVGPKPRPRLEIWTLRIDGAVEMPRVRTWDEFQGLPSQRFETDIHCVTSWSKLGTGELTIATTLYATGEDSVPVCFGNHPHLRIPEAPRGAWRVTLGAFRRLVLDEHMIPTGEREPVERRCLYLDGASLDDGFDALAVPAEFNATAEDLALTVRFVEGFSYAQVCAPRGKNYVCFEPITAPANALRSGEGLRIVSPGELHRTTFSISIGQSA